MFCTVDFTGLLLFLFATFYISSLKILKIEP